MLVTLAAVALSGVPAQDSGDPHGLAGLTEIHVALGELNLLEDMNANGLAKQIADQVREAGFTTISDEGAASLIFSADLYQTNVGLAFGEVTMRLDQPVTITRVWKDENLAPLVIPVRATTWRETEVFSSSGNAEIARATLDIMAEQLTARFITAAKEADPNPPEDRQTFFQWLWPF
jgi:hypothetical protein